MYSIFNNSNYSVGDIADLEATQQHFKLFPNSFTFTFIVQNSIKVYLIYHVLFSGHVSSLPPVPIFNGVCLAAIFLKVKDPLQTFCEGY